MLKLLKIYVLFLSNQICVQIQLNQIDPPDCR